MTRAAPSAEAASQPVLRSDPSESERRVRTDLAACYRLVAHFGMSDLIYTHISARVPGRPGEFLIKPHSQGFEEVTASSLVKVSLDGGAPEEAGDDVNPAGTTIHSAVLGAREDVTCVLHTHTMAGMTFAALNCELLPLNQISMLFHGAVGYHDYEGISLESDEKPRLVRSLGSHKALILRNHGLLTVGEDVPQAFTRMYYLDRACALQLSAMAAGAPLSLPSQEVSSHAARQWAEGEARSGGRTVEWGALLRLCDRIDGSYKG